MKGPFESVARVAIDEILAKHTVPSKFGHFLSEEGLKELSNEIFEFLQTSRELKSAGDRFLMTQMQGGGRGAPARK